jgi:hypothetical protein
MQDKYIILKAPFFKMLSKNGIILCIIFLFISCKNNMNNVTKDKSFNSNNDNDLKYREWYFYNFLSIVKEDSLSKKGLRLSICQSLGAPTYIYTVKKDEETYYLVQKILLGTEDSLINKGQNVISKPKIDSIFFLLNRSVISTDVTKEIDYSGIDDGWIIEINNGLNSHLIIGRYSDRLYFRVVDSLKIILGIDFDNYGETKAKKDNQILLRE